MLAAGPAFAANATGSLSGRSLLHSVKQDVEDDRLARAASWQPRSLPEVRQAIMRWAERRQAETRQADTPGGETGQADELTQVKLETLWPAEETVWPPGETVLARLRLSLLTVVPETQPGLAPLARPRQSTAAPPPLDLEQLAADDPFLEAQLRLVRGCWLCQNEFYDESLQELRQVPLDETLAPAALLFYRGIAAQQLLQKELALESFEQLLEREETIPRRYQRLAELVVADLRPLEPDTLDEIARLMNDIRRRQALHRAGQEVRDREDEVVEKLDKLIEEMQQQAAAQAQQAAAAAETQNPGSPMESSRAAGGKGAGNVDRQAQTPGPQWGNLDPRQRAAALAELAKDLPAHYREVIEDYFRKLAEDEKNR